MAEEILPRVEYTVGWICALPVELAAAQEMLDEEHWHFHDQPHVDPDSRSLYTLGRIGDHNVVLANLPAGQLGTNSAAAVAVQLHKDFPSVRFGLMVGIGGGVPRPDADVRLGDVVVSQPSMTHGGVIQYDLGKTRPGKFERTGFLNAPPTIVLNAVAKLQARQFRSTDMLSKHLSSLSHLPNATREYAGADVLFQASYNHVEGATCEKCDGQYQVHRPNRKNADVIVHHGTIASGNQVMRDGVTRDTLSSELGGVLCFEMEAAGLMNRLPCVVIRGICDYADSHKNKTWQPYAALTAAAYGKELLSVIPAAEAPPRLNDTFAAKTQEAGRKILQLNCQKVLESLEFPQMHHRQLVIRSPCQGTGHWLSKTSEYTAWLRGEHRFLWIKGKAGSGKSTLMKRTLEDLRNDPTRGSLTLASFFFDGSGTELEKSTTGLLRSILYQMFTQNQALLEEFMTATDARYVKGKNIDWSVEELMGVLEITSGLDSWKPTILLLDGLDEGSIDEIRHLLFFFKQHICPDDSQTSCSKFQMCLASRHYPNITMDNCPEIWVENYNHNDIEKFTHLKLSQLSDAPKNDDLVQSILDRADGVFLWVDLVTTSILTSDDYGETLQQRMEKLNETPRELDGLYTQTFQQLSENERADTFRILSWVLFSSRRLSPLELCFAAQYNFDNSTTFSSWAQSNRFINKGAQAIRFIRSRSCGLLNIQKKSGSSASDNVRFIHQTVPGFLIQKGLAILQPAINPMYMAGVCHRQIAMTCVRYLSQEQTVSCSTMRLLRSRAGQSHSRFLEWIKPQRVNEEAFTAQARHDLLSSFNSITYQIYRPSDIDRQLVDVAQTIKLVFSELPLLEYTIESLVYHINHAEEARVSQISILETFLRKGPQFLRIWYEFQDALYLPRTHHLHLVDWTDFLQGAIALGLASCVRELSNRVSTRAMAMPSSCNPTKALFLAISYGYTDIAQNLFVLGANSNARNKEAYSPLDEACRCRDVQMVRTLLKNGAQVNSRNVFGFTTLHLAAEMGAVQVAQVLLEAGAETSLRLTRNNETPLLLAVIHDHLDVLNTLIAHGADDHVRDGNGLDCLKLAVQHRSAAIYAALNPSSPELPRRKDQDLRPIHLRVNYEPISRAMTASPSPERQKEKKVQRSGRFAGGLLDID